MTTWGIVVAAGAGTRFGGDKQLVEIGDRALWEWARDSLLDGGVDGVVVVGDVEGGVAGGTRRQDSVAEGLRHVPPDADVIAVHDAARPLAPARLVTRLLSALGDVELAGAIPVVPLRDTVKTVHGDRVVGTPDRSSLVAVQTPQVFRAEWLRRAHIEVSAEVTDDAAMVEAIGGVIGTVSGEAAAFKITYPEDLVQARAHLEAGS